MEFLKYKIINSPVGLLKIVVDNDALVGILWENEKLDRVKLNQMIEDKKNSLIMEIEKQLQEYFQNKRKTFDLPIKMHGTDFQKRVWELLNKIPYGVTWSYKDIAIKMNHPRAVRAVGTAIGKNPISLVIPCHRVIATNGSLAGFAGGIDKKKILLDLESKM